MKLEVDHAGETYLLEFRQTDAPSGGATAPAYTYSLAGAEKRAGAVSIERLQANWYSIIDGTRVFSVRVAGAGTQWEVWVGSARYLLAISDVRDVAPASQRAAAKGPAAVTTQMPGKVIRLLVEIGAAVEAGQGLVIIEAMKMQNELKAPRKGTVVRISAQEGATVAANQTLLIIE